MKMNTEMDKHNERLTKAIEKAEYKFWESIAESYPEITGGDLDPLNVCQLQNSMTVAVSAWLFWNAKKGELK